MRDYFLNLNQELLECASYVKNDLIEPIKLFLENQQLLGKKFYNDFKKSEKEYNNALYYMDKVRSFLMPRLRRNFTLPRNMQKIQNWIASLPN
jgi:hypothetical protein